MFILINNILEGGVNLFDIVFDVFLGLSDMLVVDVVEELGYF